MRGLIFELRPANIEADGLLQAVRTHAAAVEGRTGLPIAVDCDMVEPVADRNRERPLSHRPGGDPQRGQARVRRPGDHSPSRRTASSTCSSRTTALASIRRRRVPARSVWLACARAPSGSAARSMSRANRATAAAWRWSSRRRRLDRTTFLRNATLHVRLLRALPAHVPPYRRAASRARDPLLYVICPRWNAAGSDAVPNGGADDPACTPQSPMASTRRACWSWTPTVAFAPASSDSSRFPMASPASRPSTTPPTHWLRSKRTVDAVLIDPRLPEIEIGLAFLQQTHQRWPKLMLVAMSGTLDACAGISLHGAMRFVAKTGQPEDLLAALSVESADRSSGAPPLASAGVADDGAVTDGAGIV